MCGIIGILGKLPSQEKFEQARDVLKHRGPDDQGTYYNPKNNIALGHRRLSIIDLSKAGHQPFFSNDQRYIIIFNGEIYNYLEIKQELKDNYKFKTKTDTQVLLAAYIQWGPKSLDKFNGMFAFVIWDKKEKKLFCARDRLGIKPFYYTIQNNSFYFASEIKALLQLDIKGVANEDIIFDYLYYGLYDHSTQTFFQNIKQLPAGHYFVWQAGKGKIKKYWDLAETENRNVILNKQETKEKFKELLTDSIKLRFRSDVPVGLCLSSGFDSNTLFYYSKQLFGERIDTFSACMPSEEYNECSLINEYLDKNQKEYWHKSYLDLNKFFQLAQEMNQTQDQPFGGIPTLALGKLNKKAKEKKIVVLLHGQGLDELCAGYKYYYYDYLKDLKSEPNNNFHFQTVSQDMTQVIDTSILNKDFIKQGAKPVFKTPFKSHLLNAQYRDIVYTKIPRTLRFSDHYSMLHSRELRVPYLDHRLVEFCFWMPIEYKINGNDQKVLAREVMEEVVPPIIKSRPKKFFGAIQVELFRKNYQDQIMSLLTSQSFKNRQYWDYKKLINKVNSFFQGKGNNSFFIWQCMNLELWFKEFIDN